MEPYIVSARKYRPQTFNEVVGQDSITSTLKNAIRNNHLAQAFLFSGPRGIGKTTCARILAKTINCENTTESIEPCGSCQPCISFKNSSSFNIFELDAASNNSVDDIRSLVEQVRIPPQDGRYKVYIIDEVHMLSASAFNAFLKTLEEPPAYAKFILATTEKHKIIPTILSRCQVFDFRRIGVEDIVKHLQYVAQSEDAKAEEDALHIIAQKADGALRDALSIFDQLMSFSGKELSYQAVIENLNVLDYDYYFKITENLLCADIPSSLLLFNDILDKGFDGQHFLLGLNEHFRNLLVCQHPQTISLLEISQTLKEKYAEQAKNCKESFLLDALEINNKADINYKASNHKKLHVEMALLSICKLKHTSASLPGDTQKPLPPPVSKQETKAADHQKKTSLSSKTVATTKTKENKATQQPQTGIISLKQSLSAKTEEKENQEEDVEENLSGPSDDFTQEQFLEKWNAFLMAYSAKYPSFTSALKKYPPELKENVVVVIKTDNKIVAHDKPKIKEILDYLRSELSNYSIRIQPVVIENQEKTTAYTDTEKYEQMVQKNPKLKELKDKLKLEINF